ncbi:hypothetical protein GCM10022378_00910 [Salinicoccus jeotgali]|uniref:DUF2938 domain-containing protein n=1 Tax=Salinicoccus jeotgali TaxID=381634 RepID=A0ABP7E5U3_9STAP
MITFLKLVLIGFISGVLLAAIMKTVRKVTGNKADILLYNMDYIPVLKQWSDKSITGILFHYATCISSAVVLYYILLPLGLESLVWPYVVVFTAGGGALYFLSALTETPPSKDDAAAWFYWTLGHAIFGFAVGGLIAIFI